MDDFAAGFVRLEGGIILDFRISILPLFFSARMTSTASSTVTVKGFSSITWTPCSSASMVQGFDKPLKIYKTIAGKPTCTEIPLDDSGNLFFEKLRSFVNIVNSFL